MESAAASVAPLETEASIVKRHDRAIAIMARRFRFDADDLIQVGRVALLQAFRDWPSKPHTSSFWTYASKAVLGEMLNYTTGEVARVAKEIESGLAPSPTCSPDLALEAKEHTAALTDREMAVISLYAAGYSLPEAAETLGISRSLAYLIFDGAVETLRGRA
jgi:RNA polymerase sigma factor (sigma-70 family)